MDCNYIPLGIIKTNEEEFKEETMNESLICIENEENENEFSSNEEECSESENIKQLRSITKDHSLINLRSMSKKKFTYNQKLILKNWGPPKPVLNIENAEKINDVYNSTDWISGCDKQKAFYCYICLVIGSSNCDPRWTFTGVSDLSGLHILITEHSNFSPHKKNYIEYLLLGKNNLIFQLTETKRTEIKKLNETIQKNIFVLNKLIDSFIKSNWFLNTEHNFTENFDFKLRKYNEKYNCQLNYDIKYEIFKSIHDVYQQLVYKELQQVAYLSITADDITNNYYTPNCKKILTARYEINGEVIERFITVMDSGKVTVIGISSFLLKELEKMNIKSLTQKIISQSYDGICVMSSRNYSVQTNIKSIYKNAHYIHSSNHDINCIIQRAITGHRVIKIFFSNVEKFPKYFENFERLALLEENVKKREPVQYTFKTNCITTVFNYKQDIIKTLEEIIDTNFDVNLISESSSLLNNLNNTEFNYWLYFFHQVFSASEILQNQIDENKLIHNNEKIREYINFFKVSIQGISNSIDTAFYQYSNSPKRIKFENELKNISNVAQELCGIIICSIEDRFEYNFHLKIASLLEPKLFSQYSVQFPVEIVFKACNLYKLESFILKKELHVIYSTPEFSLVSSPLTLQQFFYDNKFNVIFPETIKLLKIICTMPIYSVTAKNDQRNEFLGKLKSKNDLTTDCCNVSVICALESKFLQSKSEFNQLVVDHFLKNTNEFQHLFKQKTICDK